MNLSRKLLFLVIGFFGVLSSCGVYTLNGVTIPEGVKTVSVAYFENRAPLIAPTLSPILSDKLRTKFLTQTNLRLIENGGDFDITGEVTDYSMAPVGAQNNSTASVNRLQITVHAKMVCLIDPKLSFDKSFTQFEDFDASKNLADVEASLIQNISDNLVQEIFNKATLNW